MSIEALLKEFAKLSETDRREFRKEIDRAYPELNETGQSLGELYGVSDEDAEELVREFEAVERGEVELTDGETFMREIADEYGIKL